MYNGYKGYKAGLYASQKANSYKKPNGSRQRQAGNVLLINKLERRCDMYYKIKYANGDFKIVKAKNALEVIKKYDLATREHIETRVIELEGEQLAIAISNE